MAAALPLCSNALSNESSLQALVPLDPTLPSSE